ncbi:oxidoreductase [Coprinopsis marcescibilis]|uniref:Oxidoreductase n=1 Tax=Coprinopsis marcescibilis TaxID=230819 RepID=A0A5C3KJ44_COPMA|nr:oxidoreductase [Coprinopsis marcescibilis]
MSRVILITGANSGIGYELVRLLAEKGHKIYLGARNLKSGQDAARRLASDGVQNVHPIQIDPSETTEAVRDHIEKVDGKLDVLVNNAGVGNFDKPQSPDVIQLPVLRAVFETNFFGLVQTTTTLLPLVRKSSNGVILNVSSDLASNALQARPDADFHYFSAYNASKVAVNSYTISLAGVLKKEGSNIKVNSATPGLTATKLTGNAPSGKTPQEGARSLIPWALLDKDGVTGHFFDDAGNKFPW